MSRPVRICTLAAACLLAAGPSAARAATVTLGDESVALSATPLERNEVSVRLAGPDIEITDAASPLAAGAGCTQASPSQVRCPSTGVTGFTATLAGLDDTFVMLSALQSTVDGGEGADVLTGGPEIDRLEGAAGDDRLEGGGALDFLGDGPGADRVDGGPDGDVLTAGLGADRYIGGAGDDFLFYDRGVAGVAVALDLLPSDGEPGEGDDVAGDIESVSGGAGPDTLTGDGATNTLYGSGGADVLRGLAGADTLSGGDGGDTLDGADGTDSLYGNAGDDVLTGGAGADYLNGAEGDDTIQARDGAADTLVCGEGVDKAYPDEVDIVAADCELVDGRNPNGPETSITSGPEGATQSASAAFTFTASLPGSTFACRLDAGAWAPCTSPASFTGLPEGTHTFRVRATDAFGRTDPTEAIRTWDIDQTAPETAIADAPAGTTGTRVTLTLTASEPQSSYECRLDGASWSPCDASAVFTGLSEGTHTVQARATDAAGNTDATPAQAAFTVDATPPNTTLEAAPDLTGPGAAFTFAADEPGASFECRLDEGPWLSCVPPMAYSGLATGSHSFRVRAVDAFGNADASPPTHVWTVDADPPALTVAGPPAATNDPTARITWNAEQGATVQCRPAGGAWGPCGASPIELPGLAEGQHGYDLRATDAAGNTSERALEWTVDLTAPETTIASGAEGTITDPGHAFALQSSEPGSAFECRLDEGAWKPCGPSATFAGLANGERTFAFRAIDAAGNVDPTPASADLLVTLPDLLAPVTKITSGPPALTREASASIGFESEPGAAYMCRLDGGPWSPCSSPAAVSPLPVGSHLFQVRAADAAGNVEQPGPVHSWTILPPDTRGGDGPTGGTGAGGNGTGGGTGTGGGGAPSDPLPAARALLPAGRILGGVALSGVSVLTGPAFKGSVLHLRRRAKRTLLFSVACTGACQVSAAPQLRVRSGAKTTRLKFKAARIAGGRGAAGLVELRPSAAQRRALRRARSASLLVDFSSSSQGRQSRALRSFRVRLR